MLLNVVPYLFDSFVTKSCDAKLEQWCYFHIALTYAGHSQKSGTFGGKLCSVSANRIASTCCRSHANVPELSHNTCSEIKILTQWKVVFKYCGCIPTKLFCICFDTITIPTHVHIKHKFKNDPLRVWMSSLEMARRCNYLIDAMLIIVVSKVVFNLELLISAHVLSKFKTIYQFT